MKSKKNNIKEAFCFIMRNAEVTSVDMEFGEIHTKFWSDDSFQKAKARAGFIYKGWEFTRAKFYENERVIYYLFHKI